MKSTIITYCLSFLCVVIAQEQQQDCDRSVINKLITIAADPIVNECTQDSGFRYVASGGIPTSDAQYELVCTEASCKEMFNVAYDLNITSCFLLVEDKLINFGDRINEVIDTCGFNFTNSSNNGTDDNGDDNSTLPEPTTTEEPTTEEPTTEEPTTTESPVTTSSPDDVVVGDDDQLPGGTDDSSSSSINYKITTPGTITLLWIASIIYTSKNIYHFWM